MFKKSNQHSSSRNRSSSPLSFEIPKLCLTRQKRSSSIDSSEPTLESLDIASPEGSTRATSFDSSAMGQQEFVGFSEHLQVPISSAVDETLGGLESVSVIGNRRSNSFDNATHYAVNLSDDNSSDKEGGSGHNLAVPKRQLRRASWEIPKICLHCLHMETLASEQQNSVSSEPRFFLGEKDLSSTSLSGWGSSSSTCGSDYEDHCLSDSEISNAVKSRELFDRQVNNEGDLSLIIPVVKILTHVSSSNNESLENLSGVVTPDRLTVDATRTDDLIPYTDVVSLAVPVIKQRSTSLDATAIIGSPVDIFLKGEPQESPRKKQIRSKSVDSNMSKRVTTSTALMSLVQQSFR